MALTKITGEGIGTVDSAIVDNITIDGTEIDLSSGTLTMSDVLYKKVSSSTVSFVVNFETNAKNFRLANVVATGSPNANDKATVSAILGGF